jgi:hypothetical protein
LTESLGLTKRYIWPREAIDERCVWRLVDRPVTFVKGGLYGPPGVPKIINLAERRVHASRRRRLERLRQPEIEHLHRAVRSHHDVGRLQVAVDDAVLVCGLEGFGDLLGDGQGLVDGNRPAPNPVRQGLAVHELQDQRADMGRGPSRSFFQAKNRGDVGVIEGGQQLRLALEAGDTLGIGGKDIWQELQGDITLKPRVPCPIHDAHPAGAEGGNHLIRPETNTGTNLHDGLGRLVADLYRLCANA